MFHFISEFKITDMDNLMKPDNVNKSHLSGSQEKRLETSELDILRKAYELMLENSDLFFSKLTDAFTVERERRESNLLI